MKRWRPGLQIGLLLVLCVQAFASSLQVQNRLSPWNARRSQRSRTRYIILHTTEGGTAGALEKLRRLGEAHYLIGTDGEIYRIMERPRVAMHAGRSMWDGTTNLDEHSIGVEIAGYHNRPITNAQIRSLRRLLADLQREYRIPDERVLPHSMVAYGSPNRWHQRSHRGRKRCGMQFADRDLRAQLGLSRQPTFDPDVRAGRLIEADSYLANQLYRTARSSTGRQETALTNPDAGGAANTITRNRSAWDIARDRYRSSSTRYVFPDGTEKRGSEVQNWRRIPVGTRVILPESQSENAAEELLEIGQHGRNAAELAGEERMAATTIYFLPDGRVRQGSELTEQQVDSLPDGTRMLVGYVHGGYVTARRSAHDIAGAKWNHATTFYRRPDGRILSGDRMTESSIIPMMMVFFQR